METLSKEEIKAIQIEKEREARRRHDNEVWNALFVSVPERPQPTPCKVPNNIALYYGASCRTQLPADFPPGCLMRIGPNGGSPEDGFLDGDGMIQCVTFPPQQDGSFEHSTSMFSSTYVETQGRRREANKGETKKYRGSLGEAPRGLPLLKNLVWNMLTFNTLQGQKDTANTAIAEHGGRVLALMEQSPPTEITVDKTGRVRTVESMTRLNGAIPNQDPITGGSFSAHGRTCPDTGDRIHVSYSSSAAPYVRVDIFSEYDDGQQNGSSAAGWNLKRSIPVNLPTPVMVHDCAITSNYIIVLDFPLTVRPGRMLFDRFPVEYEPENGARIGLVPRGKNVDREKREVAWFDCEPGVILHAVNAYETDDKKVILHALRSEPASEGGSYITHFTASFLHEWTLDLVSGETKERCLNPEEIIEFPVIDHRFVGSKDAAELYCAHASGVGGQLRAFKTPVEGLLFDGIVKFALKDDTATGTRKGDVVGRFTLPENWYSVSEPTVVPKQKGPEKLNGSYVLMIATHVMKETISQPIDDKEIPFQSHVLVLDGDNIDAGPVCAIELPYPVTYGLHSSFLEWDKMR